MAKFPNPVALPGDVYEMRYKRHKELLKSAKWGIKVRFGIVIFELIGFVFLGSFSLFSEAIASALDILSTLFLIICVQFAKKPPDKDHPFGHGRYEPVGGFLLGMLLSVMGATLLFQQIVGAAQEELVGKVSPWAWVFPTLALIALEVCYQYISKVASKVNSPALAADAYHYRIDALTSLFAAIALILAALLPENRLLIDHIGAITIDLLMIGIGLYAAKENFAQLVDKLPDPHFFNEVKSAAKKVEGVLDTEKIGIQLYGPDAHVNIDIEVDPKLTVERSHKITQQVRAEIQKAWPAVRDVIVHVEPYYPNDH